MEPLIIPRRYEMEKFFPLMKVNEKDHTVYGLSTCEKEDKDGEISDYAGTKKAYIEWSQEAEAATSSNGQKKSLGNIRYMHKLIVAGKATKLNFDDDRKQIWLESTPSPPISKEDPDIWPLLEGGFLRGYSQGGKYASRVCNDCRKDIVGNFCNHCSKRVVVRYVPIIAEVSFVDNPCLKEAVFTLVKQDGSTELRKFSEGDIPTEVGALPTDPQLNIDTPVDSSCVCDCEECKADNHGECMKEGKCALSTAAGSKVVKTAETLLEEVKNLVAGMKAKKGVSLPKVTKEERTKEIDKFLKEGLINAIQSRAYGMLGKGMYTLSRFAELSESIKYLWLSLEFEEELEGDDSPATDSVEQCYMEFLDALLAYAEEEVAEAKQEFRESGSRGGEIVISD